jgi:NADH-quinone oxidoreductase subunit L
MESIQGFRRLNPLATFSYRSAVAPVRDRCSQRRKAMLKLLFLVPLLPLLGAILNGVFGRILRFSERTVANIACAATGLSSLIALGAIWEYARTLAPGIYKDTVFVFTWFDGGLARTITGDVHDFRVTWVYQLDPLAAVMMFIVTFVGFLIHIFAVGYMSGDAGYYRFFAYLNLFMFMMLVLVLGSNFPMMFVGWEGVGLCSYLLIGFYFDRDEAARASKKAFITNRIGDMGFMLAMFGIFALFGTLDFKELSELFQSGKAAPYVESLGQWGMMSWIAFGLFIGATGKSAQIPLFVWLPDAMAGPTPVSALIHAATMVTAGVYLLARVNYIFSAAPSVMAVVAVTGALTALVGATIGLTQTDIKKVLAYSTISQLGFMFLACGVGAFIVAIFHVFTHAFFKAQLFLGSGSVIHALHHQQDMTKMGGLKEYLPRTYMTMVAAWLAICGIIPFAGFFSKDEILLQTWLNSKALYGIALFSAFCTAFYMTRLMALTFWTRKSWALTGHGSGAPVESPPTMLIPLAILAALSLVGGWIGIPHALGGHNYFAEWLQPVLIKVGQSGAIPEASRGLEIGLMAASLASALAGIALARWIYLKSPDVADAAARAVGGVPYRLSLNKYYVDEIYGAFPIGATLRLSDVLMRVDLRGVDGVPNGSARLTQLVSLVSIWFDKYVVDLLVNLQGWIVRAGSVVLRSVQTGFVQNYALLMVLGLIAFFAVYLMTAR